MPHNLLFAAPQTPAHTTTMATSVSTLATRCAPSAARLVARSPRHLAPALSTRRFNALPVRAQKQDADKEEQSLSVQLQPSAVAPSRGWDVGAPSFSRVNQMFRSMEDEMNQLARAFGMPALAAPTSSLFDQLPTTLSLPQMPMGAKALAVDIKDTGDSLEIVADVPGLGKDEVKVQVSPDRVLSISGERKSESKEGSEEEGFMRVERSYGTFVRRFRLPEYADTEGITASTKDGVLKVTVPKKSEEAVKPKDISISSE